MAENLLGGDVRELDRLVPARPRGVSKRPVSIRFDDDTLTRLKQLASKKRTNYQTLVKNFVNERLYEEEKRRGAHLGLPAKRLARAAHRRGRQTKQLPDASLWPLGGVR